MTPVSTNINESRAATAFSAQAKNFDAIYGKDKIIQYKRERVRENILGYALAGASMLELNCGTGEDAIYFMQKGFSIHATDISEEMISELRKKARPANALSVETCSFTNLASLQNKGPYDYVYSNFGGLNCTQDLEKVIDSLAPLLNENGRGTIVVISNFCLWELLLVFKGKFKTAFRRFFAKGGRTARVEGKYFRCWYYSVSEVKRMLSQHYEVVSVEGLCTFVPPSYFEGFAEKYPRLFRFLVKIENRLKSRSPWNCWGDYFIINFEKKRLHP